MQIKTWNNQLIEIDGKKLPENSGNLIVLPALIDPHVHFRVPGGEHKEDWTTGAAIAGGVTTTCDMPNTNPSTITLELLRQKKAKIDELILKSGQKLRYYLYFGATADNLDELEKVKDEIIGVKLFMCPSTGNLLVSQYSDQEKIFKKCAELDLLLAIHAEDHEMMRENAPKFADADVKNHSKIRSNPAAAKAVKNAIEAASKYNTKLYILHASTKEELEIIRQAKKDGVRVYAEATPHHLFLDTSAYEKLGTLAQMNPPLRSPEDARALWEGIDDGIIDTIGTDHAPHTLEEKAAAYPASPSGVPGIETYLPLLLDACNKGKISLEKIAELTHFNPQKIFNIPENGDLVIVDMDMTKVIKNGNLKTKCGWSPFNGWTLKGWPVKVLTNKKPL